MSAAREKPSKAFSCIRCFERKVKCDKLNPCTNCVKHKTECVFRTPPQPRRRKRRSQDEVLLARLQHYEDLLRSKGINIDDESIAGTSLASPDRTSTAGSQATTVAETTQSSASDIPVKVASFAFETNIPGELITDRGRSRFLDNNLWSSVTSEFREPMAAIDDQSSEEDDIGSPIEENTDFVFGYTPSVNNVYQYHPSPEKISLLWHIFLDNINPMTKLIHRPSLEISITEAAQNVEAIPKSLEALMFSIYASAIFSMGEDECEWKFSQTRRVLLNRYRHATRKALARCRFMGTSDIVVLQAFVLHLLIMREDYDARTLWTLTGVASRIAQGMGIHRDGTNLGLPPFDTEMRRRLWWQVTTLDFRSAELSGSGRLGDFNLSDSKPPSNVNDADIYPGMPSPPVPQPRATEMVACLMRCEFGTFWKEKVRAKTGGGDFTEWKTTNRWKSTLEERDAAIDELEQRLEEKFVRYCDPMVPIQFLATLIARSAIKSMRFMAHHPRKYNDPKDVPESEHRVLWDLSVKMLEADCLAHSSRHLQRFRWHVNVYFQWQAFIYLAGELRKHTLGDAVDHAWAQIDEVFEHHRNFITDHKRPLHAAVGSLVLKAYAEREKALRQHTHGAFPKVVPEYIRLLREHHHHLLVEPAADPQPSASLPEQPVDSVEKVAIPGADAGAHHPTEQLPTPQLLLQQQQPPQPSQQQQQPGQLGQQLPLPPTVPLPSYTPGSPKIYPSDAMIVQDLVMQDMTMDWVQWDQLMDDFSNGVA